MAQFAEFMKSLLEGFDMPEHDHPADTEAGISGASFVRIAQQAAEVPELQNVDWKALSDDLSHFTFIPLPHLQRILQDAKVGDKEIGMILSMLQSSIIRESTQSFDLADLQTLAASGAIQLTPNNGVENLEDLSGLNKEIKISKKDFKNWKNNL